MKLGEWFLEGLETVLLLGELFMIQKPPNTMSVK